VLPKHRADDASSSFTEREQAAQSCRCCHSLSHLFNKHVNKVGSGGLHLGGTASAWRPGTKCALAKLAWHSELGRWINWHGMLSLSASSWPVT
jgi:hypothetical protein